MLRKHICCASQTLAYKQPLLMDMGIQDAGSQWSLLFYLEYNLALVKYEFFCLVSCLGCCFWVKFYSVLRPNCANQACLVNIRLTVQSLQGTYKIIHSRRMLV